MSKFKDMTQEILRSLAPQPNPFIEQAKELLDNLEPVEKAQVLAQLAVAEEINKLRNAVRSLDSTISLKS